MAAKIQGITIRTETVRQGLRRARSQEVLYLRTTGGDIILPQSAVEGAGDSWGLLKRRLETAAREKGIPFQME